jgi:FkbM family methyltransferase
MKDTNFYLLARVYSTIYGFFKDKFGVNLRGLGFALRQINTDRVIEVRGRKIFFNHQIAASYGRHLEGKWNEPETHALFDYVIPKLDGSVAFIDVGANIGEFLIDVSKHSKVKDLVGFEPISECCHSIQESMKLNGVDRFLIYQSLVGSKVKSERFAIGKTIGGSSVYSNISKEAGDEIAMTTLDKTLSISATHAILLVDVEGYELEVLKGGRNFILSHRPLIVFEYNSVSKQYFLAAEISKVLGNSYDILRLRQDGRLDRLVDSAWTCVAIPDKSLFKEICADLCVD